MSSSEGQEIFDALYAECKRHEYEGNYTSVVHLLSVPILHATSRITQKLYLESLYAYALLKTKNYKGALQAYRDIIRRFRTMYMTADADYVHTCTVIAWLYGNVYAHHDAALFHYREARDLCAREPTLKKRTNFDDILRRLAVAEAKTKLTSYAKGRPANAPCMCWQCGSVGQQHMLLCECERAWYCNERCKAEYGHRHVLLDPLLLLPRDVVVQKILLPAIMPANAVASRTDLHSARHFGLSLRLLSRMWRQRIDECGAFWFRVVPFDWSALYKPGPRDEYRFPSDVALAKARTQYEAALLNKHRLLTKKLDAAEKRAVKAAADKADMREKLDALESRLKRARIVE